MSDVEEIALAVIVEGGRVLVARRGEGHLAGTWEFPGGKIETGESAEDAARRECAEELGVSVRAGGEILVHEHEYESKRVRLHCVECEISEGEVPRAIAATELAWVSLEELRGMPIPPANDALIERLTEAGIGA